MLDLKTRWSDNVGEIPFPEYPRPQYERDNYMILNGTWEYAICDTDQMPTTYDGEILVPFSPECLLSGVKKMLMPDQFLWYKRQFVLEEGFNKGRVFLHFGAVDQYAQVYLNGKLVGENMGGYYPFTFEITDFLQENNELIVKVIDKTDTAYHDFGKQKLTRGGIWYSAQSGIWQTVWLESTPKDYLEKVKITPSLKRGEVNLQFFKKGEGDVLVEVSYNGKVLLNKTVSESEVDLKIDEIYPWSPETPNLYDLKFTFNDDQISSYFALRDVEIKKDKKGRKRIFLNGAPYFMHGILDQGYWSDGMYTPPCEEAFEFDIKLCKEMGFNTIRKHIKVEPLRWYYLCDKIGMLVWQDMVSGGGEYSWFFTVANQFFWRRFRDGKIGYKRFGRLDERGRQEYYTNLKRMIEHLYNVPSIVLWTPFNEGWGQFDSKKAYKMVKEMDKTRFVDHASGWHDQGIGDFKSRHIYFRPVRLFNDIGFKRRPYILTEYGGYGLKIPEHSFNPDDDFGYKAMESVEMLNRECEILFNRDIVNKIKRGLCADIYTQVSDVEDETNGLCTYDREIVKFDKEMMQGIAEKIKKEYEKL